MIRRETPDAETHAIAADIGDPDASAGIIRETIDRFGRLDALINNAGAAPLKPIHEHTPAVLREAFAVNALGPGALIAAAWPHLVARNAGVIVNLSTMGTADPFPGFFAYAAAKAAVNSYARSIATEGAAHNIKGFAIAPGAVETPMLRSLFDETALPRDRTLSPDAIAKIVVECVTGKRDPQNGTTIFVPSPG